MQFEHEKLQETIEYHQKRIEIIKGQLMDKEYLQKHAIIWQLTNDGVLIICDITGISKDDVYVSTTTSFVQFKVDGLSQFQFDNIMDGIDDILESEGFKLMPDMCRFLEYSNTYSFVYRNDDGVTLDVDFSSRTCNRVETGKMVPEIKQVCNLFAA